MKNINLINAETRITFIFLRLKKKAKLAMTVAVSFFVILTGLTLGLLFYTQSQVAKKKDQISQLTDKIKSFEKNESYVITITDRVKGISPVLNERGPVKEILSDLVKLSVPGFSLQSFTADSSKVTIKAYCQDLAALTNFNARLEDLSQEKRYRNIYYSSVSKISGNNYLIVVEIEV